MRRVTVLFATFMTLKEIEAFYWTAVLGNFSLAAARLHVTQSSLSKRVAELESSVGATLFDRSSKHVQLTEAGAKLMPLARQVLDVTNSMMSAAASVVSLTGECRFGISELVALTWLPTFVGAVRQRHPGLKLQPYVDLARALEKRVVRGELDFAVAPGPAESEAVISDKIAGVEFSWIGSPSRVRPGTVLEADDLKRYPLITMTQGSGLTRAFENWADDQGMAHQKTVACNSLMGIVGLTVADVGISFVPTSFVQPWIDSGALLTMTSIPPFPALDYCFIYRRDDSRTVIRELKIEVHSTVKRSTWSLPMPFISTL